MERCRRADAPDPRLAGMVALPDLECEVPGMQQRSDPVVDQSQVALIMAWEPASSATWDPSQRTDTAPPAGPSRAYLHSISGRAADPADIRSFEMQAATLSRYVEFDVPANSVVRGGREDWGILPGPDSMYSRLQARRGLPPYTLPPVESLQWIASRVP